ncbi:unnamed protein product [Phytophthora lilii]|uniref:Unnamed protein product n=1 Tax=Phytophthora lilii TaxID=2077276 RepID=A0A9W7CGM3_9STRA|nr:unnamed protein product [Phytophthora lilii]
MYGTAVRRQSIGERKRNPTPSVDLADIIICYLTWIGNANAERILLSTIEHDAERAIARIYRLVSNRVEIYPATLTLYLARSEGGAWLKDDDGIENLLSGEIVAKYKKMRSSWRLNKQELLGPNFMAGDEDIHVLVKLPRLTPYGLPQEQQLVVGDVHIPVTQTMSLNPPALVEF